jgi:hypothetical protein
MNLVNRMASVHWKGGTRAMTTESDVLKRGTFSLGTPLKSNFIEP